MPRIELLWWDGCPSYPKAIADLRQVMEEQGLDPDALDVHEVPTEADAQREEFLGSPTIRMDGEDIFPTNGSPIGLTCRVYRLRDGRPSPVPDREDVRQALRRAMDTE